MSYFTSLMIIKLLLGLLLLSNIVANGAEHDYPLPVSTLGRQHTNITIGPGGNVVVSFVTPLKSGFRIGMAVSSDDGITWSVADSVSFMRASMNGLQRRPTIVMNGDGSLVCSYEDVKVGDAMPRAYVTRATSLGSAWSDPVAVVRGFQAPTQDFISMASDGKGRLAIAFIAVGESGTGRHVYVVTSADNGLSWLDPVRANNPSWSGNACECCMTSVAYSPSGVLGVAFRANRKNIRDVHVAFSLDNGSSFQTPVLIQDGSWTIAGCPSTGPNLTFDNQNVAHMSWRDYRDTVQRPVVYYAKLAVGDLTTPRNVDLSTAVAEDADYPSVSVSPDGQTVNVIHESSNGVRIAESFNGGNTFSSRVVDALVKRNASCYMVRLRSGSFLAVWTSSRDDRFDVATATNMVSSVNEEAVGPRLFDGWVEIPNGAVVNAVDVTGRMVELEERVGSVRTIRPASAGLVYVSFTAAKQRVSFAIMRTE